ncbi:MAG: hypothetical protein ACK5ME_06575 [Parahaliea sp.]
MTYLSAVKYRVPCLVALIVVPVLAWTQLLDTTSQLQITEAMSDAGIFYATARGINALVSMLQGTEISLPFITFSVGEILDPINDLIERFSGIILFAIASLALQQILMLLVSHSVFNMMLTALSALAVAALVLRNQSLFYRLLRFFILAVFIRFAFALMIIANHWVDSAFLAEDDRHRHEAMQSFQQELETIQEMNQATTDLSDDIAALEILQTQQVQAIAILDQQVEAEERAIIEAADRVNTLRQQEGAMCRLPVLGLAHCSQAVQQAQQLLEGLRAKQESYSLKQRQLGVENRDVMRQIDCLQKRHRGQRCGVLDLIPTLPDTVELRRQLDALDEKAARFSQNVITLLTSVMLKAVLIPLLFMLLLWRVTRHLWRWTLQH